MPLPCFPYPSPNEMWVTHEFRLSLMEQFQPVLDNPPAQFPHTHTHTHVISASLDFISASAQSLVAGSTGKANALLLFFPLELQITDEVA